MNTYIPLERYPHREEKQFHERPPAGAPHREPTSTLRILVLTLLVMITLTTVGWGVFIVGATLHLKEVASRAGYINVMDMLAEPFYLMRTLPMDVYETLSLMASKAGYPTVVDMLAAPFALMRTLPIEVSDTLNVTATKAGFVSVPAMLAEPVWLLKEITTLIPAGLNATLVIEFVKQFIAFQKEASLILHKLE